MTGTTAGPPFDPELAAVLDATGECGRTLTPRMLPQRRALDVTEDELDARLQVRGLERRACTVPGHLGAPIRLARHLASRADRRHRVLQHDARLARRGPRLRERGLGPDGTRHDRAAVGAAPRPAVFAGSPSADAAGGVRRGCLG